MLIISLPFPSGNEQQTGLPFTTQPINNAIDVFGMVHSLSAHAERAPGHTLRPASRD